MAAVELIETVDFPGEASAWIAGRIREVQRGGGLFTLGLCGGGTPVPVYERLARHDGIDWTRVIVTFGDERAVPPDHPDSNFRMAKAALLESAGIPEGNVIRIECELRPSEAARRCEAELRVLAAARGEAIFRHDLVLLGLGEDGHIASLFPESAALEERDRWVVENQVAKFGSWRVTFTYPLINAAREVAFLVSGEKKRPVVEEVWEGVGNHPAARVSPESVTWLLGA